MSRQLAALASAGLAENAARTAGYRFSTVGLVADKDIVAAVTLHQRQQAVDNLDDAKYLDLLRKKKGRYKAARSLGIDPVSLSRRIKYDAAFAEAVAVAEAEALEGVVATAIEMAEAGNSKMIQLLLASKRTEEFGEKAKQVNVNVTRTDSTSSASDDPIVSRIRQLEADVRQSLQAKELGPALDIEDAEFEDDA